MICPVCKHVCDEEEKCLNCGRPLSVSEQLIRDRRRFLAVLFACHLPWLLIGIGLPMLWLLPRGGRSGVPADVIALIMAIAIAPTFLAVIGGAIAIELLLVLPILCHIEASKAARDLWCVLVGVSIAFPITFALMNLL